MQLDIILTSLQDHGHVASLLGFGCQERPEVLLEAMDTNLAEILMKTILRNLTFHVVRLAIHGSLICNPCP